MTDRYLASALQVHRADVVRDRDTFMAAKELPTYLSLEEAAKVMSLSAKTIRRRIADGTMPAYQCGSRAVRIRLDELETALRRIPSAKW